MVCHDREHQLKFTTPHIVTSRAAATASAKLKTYDFTVALHPFLSPHRFYIK